MITQLQQLQGATLQQLQQLYQQIQFPMEVRYYCAPWIEAQQWGSIDTDSPSSEPAATILLQQLVQQINEKCKELTGETMFVIRMRLDEFAKALCNRFGKNPLEFVRVVLHCLESEKRLVEQVLVCEGTFFTPRIRKRNSLIWN
jgi:signal transducer and activator of transcription 5B